MSLTLIPLPELNRKAYAILCRELGVPDTLRFFGQLGLGRGNYTEERKTLFADLTLEEFERGTAKMRAGTAGRGGQAQTHPG